MIGPSYTLLETGNVLQASTSLGSSYGMQTVRKNVSNEVKAERICQTVHSSELTEIFFETLDRDDCIFDPMSIYR